MSDDTNTAPPPAVRGPDARVSTYTSAGTVTVAPTATLREIARLIADAGIGCVVVGTRDAVDAVVSERDIARAVAGGLDLDRVTAGEVGSRDLVWVESGDTIAAVAEEMMEDYVRHVLVRHDGRLVGVLSMRDVLSAYVL